MKLRLRVCPSVIDVKSFLRLFRLENFFTISLDLRRDNDFRFICLIIVTFSGILKGSILLWLLFYLLESIQKTME